MTTKPTPHVDLQQAARQKMLSAGFEPEFPAAAQQQLANLLAHPPAISPGADVRDLRQLLWSSIDNDTSRDLDQAEVAERLPTGEWRVQVAIADVDAFVAKHTPIDDHAAKETTTVYTGVRMFPMLPEALSTGATSLLGGGDKIAVVIAFVVNAAGEVTSGELFRAIIRNQAQLAYDGVGAWLERRAPAPAKVAASSALSAQLILQDAVAQALRTERYRHGALEFDSLEVRPVMQGNQVVDIAKTDTNRATQLIEEFMVAANGVVARALEAKGVSAIRRVVKTPKRWDRIVELAKAQGAVLPDVPDAKALGAFLTARKAADPDHFADLSLAVVKLMGPGEYVLDRPGDAGQGHFGLAVNDYTHSTAPNRRFADLVTQRVIKATLAGAGAPYSDDELAAIAHTCTTQEDMARKVEREMTKWITAVAMSGRIGEHFDAIVTGVGPKGTFVRVLQPHMEGLLARGGQGLDVGDRLRVTLIRTDLEHGYIDFSRDPSGPHAAQS